MATVSAVPAFLDALRSALVSNVELVGVYIYTADVPLQDRGMESICVNGQVTSKEEAGNLSGTLREERIIVPMAAMTSNVGTDLETAVSGARSRCFALVEAVESLRDSDFTCDATVTDWQITDRKLYQGMVPDVGMVNQITFTLSVLASFTP